MKKKFKFVVLLAEILMLAAIFFKPDVAVIGARNGLILWSYTVLPGIFPASFLSSVILNKLHVSGKYLRLYVILCGILTGFPGAAVLYGEYRKVYADDKTMDGILAYCNISSPSFVCCFLYSFEICQSISLARFLAVIYISSFAGIFIVLIFEKINKRIIVKESGLSQGQTDEKILSDTRTDCGRLMETSCINMIKAGGYIVFFSCLSQYVTGLFANGFIYRGLLTGFIEITTGINQFCSDCRVYGVNVFADGALAVLLINNFGGMSTLLQTIAVAGKTLDIKKYIYNKLIYCMITFAVYRLVIYV